MFSLKNVFSKFNNLIISFCVMFWITNDYIWILISFAWDLFIYIFIYIIYTVNKLIIVTRGSFYILFNAENECREFKKDY